MGLRQTKIFRQNLRGRRLTDIDLNHSIKTKSYLYFFMLDEIKIKYNKRISSLLAATYFAFIVVVSFHFHGVNHSQEQFLSENENPPSEFQGDSVHPNGICQFLLNYKSSIDISPYSGVEIHFRVSEDSFIFTKQSFNNSHQYNTNLLRAPPAAPYIFL